MAWVGWVISFIALIVGIAQVVIIMLVRKANRLQEERFKDIKKQLDGLGKFKDDVLAGYPTRAELSAHRNECNERWSNVFDRLRDLERGVNK